MVLEIMTIVAGIAIFSSLTVLVILERQRVATLFSGKRKKR